MCGDLQQCAVVVSVETFLTHFETYRDTSNTVWTLLCSGELLFA